MGDYHRQPNSPWFNRLPRLYVVHYAQYWYAHHADPYDSHHLWNTHHCPLQSICQSREYQHPPIGIQDQYF